MLTSFVRRAALAISMAFIAPNIHAAERDGFLIGFTIGGGALYCDTCESSGAGAFGFELGGSVSEKVSIHFDTVGLGHEESDHRRYSYQFLGSARYWPSGRVWVGGGVGFGQNEIQVGNVSEESSNHFAFALQAGVEVVQRGKFALDIRGRYGRTSTAPGTDYVVALAGFTWY